MEKLIRGRKIRIYPDNEQEQKMLKTNDACRFVWNYMVAIHKIRYEAGYKYLGAFDMINGLTYLKQEEGCSWLNDVSRASLAEICRDVDKSYQKAFKHKGRSPKFKSKKKEKIRFPVRSNAVYFKDNEVNIEKIGKVKYKTDFKLGQGKEYKFHDARISYEKGKWFLSLSVECENQAVELNDVNMGIDLGLKELAIAVYGGEEFFFHNINKSKQMKDYGSKLIHLQRSVSRKYEVSKKVNDGKYVKTNNIIKEEEKIRQIYRRMTNIRNNYIHQITHKLVYMLPKRITMEDLNVIGMMKNKHLSKQIGEAKWSEFVRQIEYKSEELGIEFIKADRFFPSSKTCSRCGNIYKELKLSDRVYECGCCGLVIDRDLNAAYNLKDYVAN